MLPGVVKCNRGGATLDWVGTAVDAVVGGLHSPRA